MKRKFLHILLAIVLLAACNDDIAVSPDMQPTPSVDTLHIGTVLAENPSPTYGLKLYNRNEKELQLTSIRLRNAATSGFRMNVDGMNGSDFTQSELLRIAPGDSLFLFVEATFPHRGGVSEELDYIDVLCNGRTRTVVLAAESRDVRMLRAYFVEKDETWQGEEIQVFDSLVVAEGATLILGEGTTLYMHDKADIVVYGSLQAKGRLGMPINIRGDRTDWMFEGTLPYDNLPSQWGGLYLRPSSHDNTFERADIRGMSRGIVVEADSRFLSCRIKNSDGNLIFCRNAFLEINNCELKNSTLSLLETEGGKAEIIHSTLANYHFASLSQHFALVVNDSIPTDCRLTNSIVYGNRACPDSIFDHCFFDDDPLFLKIEPRTYTFDLHLSADSPCRGAGNPEAASRAPYDLDGILRKDSPSIGCYE